MDNKPLEFWAAVLVAVLVKASTSNRLGWKAVTLSIFVALGSAYAFTQPIAEMMGHNENIVAALVAITSEAVMRGIIQFTNKPDFLKSLIQFWRGGSSGEK